MACRRAVALVVALLNAVALVALLCLIDPASWGRGLLLWVALAWGAWPFGYLAALARPARWDETDTEPGTCAVLMMVRYEPADVAYAGIAAAAARGPTIALLADEALRATHVPPDVPWIVVGPGLPEPTAAIEMLARSDAVLLVTAGAFPDVASAARLAGRFRDPAIGWVVADAVPFNRDGYGPTTRDRLDQRLRRSARGRGVEVWEPNATLLRTSLLLATGEGGARALALPRSWGWWMRRWRQAGYRGVTVRDVVAAWEVPVSARWYWRESITRARVQAADLTDAIVGSRALGRRYALALLARSLYAYSLGLLLLGPALAGAPKGFPFRGPAVVVLAMVAGVGVLRWATLRWVHDAPVRPGRDLLGAAYGAPGSLLALDAVIRREARPTRLPIPARPLGWVAVLLALAMTLSITTVGGGGPTLVTLAAAELVLLWLFAAHGIWQLMQPRDAYRIPARLSVDVGDRRATTSYVSPRGFGLQGASPIARGATAPVVVHLDDGSELAADVVAKVDAVHREGSTFEFVPNVDVRSRWAGQLARIALARARRAAPPERLGRTPGRVLNRVATGVAAVVAISGAAVLLSLTLGLRPHIIRSGSMEPALHVGDIVLVRDLPPGELRVGDIATIDLHDDGGTTHRVKSVATQGDEVRLRTQGDANEAGEVWTLDAASNVARVEGRIPYVGYHLAGLSSIPVRPRVVWIAIGTAAVAVVVVIVRRWRAVRAPAR